MTSYGMMSNNTEVSTPQYSPIASTSRKEICSECATLRRTNEQCISTIKKERLQSLEMVKSLRDLDVAYMALGHEYNELRKSLDHEFRCHADTDQYLIIERHRNEILTKELENEKALHRRLPWGSFNHVGDTAGSKQPSGSSLTLRLHRGERTEHDVIRIDGLEATVLEKVVQ